MITWTDHTREQVRFLQDQLIAITQQADASNASAEMREWLMAPIRQMIETVYERDMPLAKLADESDLLLHIRGPAASGPTPRVSLLTRMLTATREQVTRLVKELAGIGDMLRVPPSLDLGLVGLARGSLFIGFSASEQDGAELAKVAVDSITQASVLVEEEASIEKMVETFPEPGVRDLSVAAIQRLSPSGRGGVLEIDLYGRAMDKPVSLTTRTRRAASILLLSKPEVAKERGTFIGTVREIDLDASRFELRNVDGFPYDIRCAHDMSEGEVKPLMDQRVRVTGEFELSARKNVRLIWVENVELLDA